MGIANIINVTGSAGGGEIIRELSSSSDGQGLHFNGAAGGINLGSSMPDLGTKYSLEFVVKGDSKTGETYLLDAYKSGARIIFAWSGYSNGNIQLHINGTWSSAFMATPDNGEVVHLILSVDGTSATLYKNGNAESTQTVVANTMTSATSSHIGSSQNGTGNFFNGSAYRTRFYNKALTQSEVDSAYQKADVDFADQYGSQTELSTNTFVNAGFAGFSGNAAGFTTSGSATNNAVYKNQTFTAGKKYRLKFTIADGNSSNLLLLFRSSTGGAGANVGKIDSSNLGTVVSDTYLQLEATGNYELILSDLGSAQSIRVYAGGDVGAVDISAFSIVQIGAVADYDLAFANPTQSLMVQDRAGVADGTASASGVSQTQPIVQLNSTSARIGSGAATPGDGELFVGGQVKIEKDGMAIKVDGTANTTKGIFLRNTGNQHGYLHTDGSLKLIAEDAGKTMSFYTANDGTGTARMVIDSAGNVLVNGGGYIKIGPSDSTAVLKLYRNDASISSDAIGDIDFGGADADNDAAARIRAKADGTWTATSSPTKLEFSTCPSGSETLATRLTISAAGLVTVGNQVKVTSSNAGSVAFSVGDAGTGLYNTGSNSVGIATNGVQRINVNNGGEIIVNDSTGTEAGRITTIGNNLTISGTVADHCGFSFATNSILPTTVSATNNNIVSLGQNGNNYKDLWLAGEAKLAGFTTLGGFNDLTIASGAVTATSSTHNIDTEGGGATDYLDTINGGSTGSIITLMAASGSRTVVVEDGTNLKLAGDCTLDNAEDTITLIKSGSAWHEVSRSNNGA